MLSTAFTKPFFCNFLPAPQPILSNCPIQRAACSRDPSARCGVCRQLGIHYNLVSEWSQGSQQTPQSGAVFDSPKDVRLSPNW